MSGRTYILIVSTMGIVTMTLLHLGISDVIKDAHGALWVAFTALVASVLIHLKEYWK